MSTSRSLLVPGPNRAVLRWSESPNSPSREEPVDVLQARPSETLIRGALQVHKKTRVYLIKNGYTRIGIVKSCWADRGLFLMEIAISSAEPLALIARRPADPGVLAVDDFVTEEQEAEILNNLDLGQESESRQFVPNELEERLAGRVVVDLQHLLRGISRTPAKAPGLWPRPVTVH